MKFSIISPRMKVLTFCFEPFHKTYLQKEIVRELFSKDVTKLSLDGLIDTGALTSAIFEADLNKNRFLSNGATKDNGPETLFQIMVSNGQLERPSELSCLNSR